MNESRAITGLDRLPWLADEREAPRRARSGGRPIAIALLILGVAALSYWLGTKSWTLFPDRQAIPAADRSIPLPEPVPIAPEPEILNEPAAAAAPSARWQPTSPPRTNDMPSPRRM